MVDVDYFDIGCHPNISPVPTSLVGCVHGVGKPTSFVQTEWNNAPFLFMRLERDECEREQGCEEEKPQAAWDKNAQCGKMPRTEQYPPTSFFVYFQR
jgi:hypothetical protein